MGRNVAKEAVNSKLVQKQDVPKVFNGFLGNYNNVVVVPGKLNYVYVTMADGMVTQAFNVIAPTILKLPVICGYDQNQLSSGLLKVISVRNVPRQTTITDPTTNFLNNHHKSHEWMSPEGGTDVVYSQLRQFMPFRPQPADDMSVYVAGGMALVGGVWKEVGNQTVDLNQYVPDSGGVNPPITGSAVKGRFVLISIDNSSGSAVVTSGSEIGVYSIGLSDIPATPVGNYPICAVVLYYYQTEIVEVRTRSDLIDLRWGLFSSNVLPITASPVASFYLTGYDAVTGLFSSGSVAGGVSGSGGIPEAPIDTKQYGRQDGAWTEIISGSGSTSGSVANQAVFLTTPLTSTAWNGDTKTSGSSRGIIDLSTVFAAPAGIKAVLLSIRGTSGSPGDYIRFGPTEDYDSVVTCRVQVASILSSANGIVPCDANGDIYCYMGTGHTLTGVYLEIFGYWT